MATRMEHPAVRALRHEYRADGITGALCHLRRRLAAQGIERERHFVITKDLDDIPVPARRGTLTVEPLTCEHLPALGPVNRERGDNTGDPRFAEDLEAGYRGLVAFKDGELAGFYWWTEPTMPPHRDFRTKALGIRLGPREVYGFDLYIRSDHRCGGTAAEFLFLVESWLRERGFERIWGEVREDNRRARWLYWTRGYEQQWAVEGTRVLRKWRFRKFPIP